MVVAVGEDFPAALVAGEIVQLKVAVFAGADHDGEALGLGEGLVDVGAVGTDEQLAHQLRAYRGGAVDYLSGGILQGLAAVHRHLDRGVQWDGAGVGGVDGGDGVHGGGDGGQRGVGEGCAEEGKAAAGAFFLGGAGGGSLVRLLQAIADDGFDVGGVGLAQDAAVVSGGGGRWAAARGWAGDGADAEIEGIILAAGFGVAVFRHRALFLADFDAEVAVAEVGPGFGGLGD